MPDISKKQQKSGITNQLFNNSTFQPIKTPVKTGNQKKHNRS